MRIRISLPDDRDFAGQLEVLDADGAVVFGPVPAAGRAHDELASAHDNASRSPLLPYGDTPLGTYAVRGVVELGDGGRDGEARGAGSVVLLEPATGQAALADAHGRFRFFIQGGGGDEDLHATAGGIRLRNQDHMQLVALVRRARGSVRCEIVAMNTRGSRISLARAPADRDPPVLPGLLGVAMRASSGSGNAFGAAGAVRRGAGYAPRMFVATETSGSDGGGGTAYGGSAGAPGDDTGTPSGSTGTPDDPLPATGVDVAPRPGVDLNLPPDQTIVRIMDTPGGLLFPAATSPSGFTPIVGVQAGGWVFSLGTQTTDPYANTLGSGPNTPYTGNPGGPYSGGPQEGAVANQYTGTPPTEPYTNTVVSAVPVAGADQTGPAPIQRDTLENQDAAIQEMVQRFQQYDQELAASQAAQSQQQSPNAQPTVPNTSPPATTPGQDSSSTSAQPNTGMSQPNPQANPATPPSSSADDSMYPWGPAAAVGAASSQANLPSGASSGGGQSAPPRMESTGAWDRANPSQAAQAGIQEQIAMGFLDPALGQPGANISSATASTEGSINRLIRGQTAEISAYDARVAQGEVGILAPKGASVRGLDYATASRLPSGDYQINVGDTASRYTTNPFKTSPGAAPPAWQAELANAFGPNGNFSLPDPVLEQGIRDAFTAGRISPVQIDTVDFSPQGQGRMSINGAQVDSASTPSRGGGGVGIGSSAALGGALGGGVATAINAIQILANPDAHPGAGRELATTAVLGTASGATGATIESAFARSMVSAVGGAEASGLESAIGRSAGGALAGGPAAAVFTLGQMALSDKEYTVEDYEAKGARSFVSGTAGGLSGALAAGVVGAIGLSEVPLLGTAVGFVGGFLGYLAFDALFGDEVEGAVRGQSNPIGDFEVLQDPSGFLT